MDDYVAKLPVKTIVLRQTIREGLVAARLLGAKHANGEVMFIIVDFRAIKRDSLRAKTTDFMCPLVVCNLLMLTDILRITQGVNIPRCSL